jgi:hypothetical protein
MSSSPSHRFVIVGAAGYLFSAIILGIYGGRI